MGNRWVLWLAIGIGGAGGSLLRYAVSRVTQQNVTTLFPVGTLIVNLVGCLMIGFCFVYLQRASPAVRAGVTVGFIGGLTTFSTYCLESMNLLSQRQMFFGAMNLIGSVVLGLIAVFLGMVLARSISGS
ncbi:MAG: fluoride efflux transporter CrcB [Phycisphaerales bacterium]